MDRSNTIDDYLSTHRRWQQELLFLRHIMMKTDLQETVKWGAPVYTINKKNVVGLGAFKSYVGLWFFQGVFLNDEDNLLINAQEGKTQAMRQWRFNALGEMDEILILTYVQEAIANQIAGIELKPQKKPLIIPDELEYLLSKNSVFDEKFKALSLTCQREYADYISEAKKEATKRGRIERIIPMILKNQGLNDKYR